jgi:hypothetical protein
MGRGHQRPAAGLDVQDERLLYTFNEWEFMSLIGPIYI